MIKRLNGLFSGGPYYVQISRDLLSVENASTQSKFSDKPLVSISNSPKKKVLDIGSSAPTQNATIVNPFDHPRLLVHDFQVTEKLFQHAFLKVAKHRYFSPSPIAVLHVIEPLEGGLTTIEMRVLREAAYSAGAREVYIWDGPQLTTRQLQDGSFKSNVI